MRNKIPAVLCILGLSAIFAPAQESTKPNLSGSWQLSPANSKIDASKVAAGTWLIQQDGSAIHISRVETLQDNKETKKEIRCTTDGKECKANGMKVSLWYAGDALVELDVASEITSEYSMSVTPDRKALTVDVRHITPAGDAEKLVFNREETAAENLTAH